MNDYRVNKETGGICTLNEFMKRFCSCEKCPKKRICDETVEEYQNYKKRGNYEKAKKNLRKNK